MSTVLFATGGTGGGVGAVITGTLTYNGAPQSLTLASQGTSALTFTATQSSPDTASFIVEVSDDGTNWVGIPVVDFNYTGQTKIQPAGTVIDLLVNHPSPAGFYANVGGWVQSRIRQTSVISSGSFTIVARAMNTGMTEWVGLDAIQFASDLIGSGLLLPVSNQWSAISNGLNSTGTLIQSEGMVAQFDDASPSAVTENRFGPVRMSSRRNLLGEHGMTVLQSSGTWDSGTAAFTTFSFDVTGLSTVVLYINVTPTITAGVLSFSGTSGATFVPGLIGLNLATQTTDSQYLLTGAGSNVTFNVDTLTTFTVTLSTAIVGGGNVVVQARGTAGAGQNVTFVKPADGTFSTVPKEVQLLAATTHGGGEGDVNLDVSTLQTLVLRVTGDSSIVLTTPYKFQAKDSSGASASDIYGRQVDNGDLVKTYPGFQSSTRYYIFNVAGLTTFQFTQGTFSAGTITFSAYGSSGYNPGAQSVLPARANAAAPTFIEGVYSPLSVDLAGGLRISGSIGVIGVVDTELPTATLLADGDAIPNAPKVGSVGMLYNGSTLDFHREIVSGQDTPGTGIAASGLLGQFDDVSTSSVTENRFAPIRISTRRNLYTEAGWTDVTTTTIDSGTANALFTCLGLASLSFSTTKSTPDTASFVVEASNNGTNFVGLPILDLDATGGMVLQQPGTSVNLLDGTHSATTHGFLVSVSNWQQVRIRFTSVITSGSIAINSRLSSSLVSFPVVGLSAGSAVIGHVITDTGSTTAVTGNVTVVQPTGTNLHAVIDSGAVTANAGTNLNTSLLALEAGGNLAASAASLSVLDDWDETDRAKVNLIVGQAGISAGTGVDGATVPRVTLATNVPLPAGSNTIGAVTNTVLSVVGGGTEATAQRVTIATDSTGVLSVDDNGGTLTVDAPVGTPVFVRLSDGSAAITTLPVSLASVPTHAVTQSGAWSVTADTELPLAAALADATANPTVPGVGAFGMVWNSSGNEWERMPGDATAVYVAGPGGQGVSCNTEISAGVTPADGLANATVMGQLLVRLEGFNGTTWDRLKSDTTNGLQVNVTKTIGQRTATSTSANVSASASSVVVIVSNSNRLGATVYNDSTSIAYLKLGSTASATSFTVVLRGNSSGVGGYYEIPFGYTGTIEMIWVTATGSARVVEFT